MSRTTRIIVFGGVVLAAWCFSSDQLLSRVASDEGYDDPAAAVPAEQNESDYQVVKLLSKLFTSIKRNHVEVLNLHRQYARSQDNGERSDLRKQMAERIGFVDGKAREYQQLVPSLQQSYPGLKSVISSFTRDLKGISGDLDLIQQTDQIASGGAREDGERADGEPRRRPSRREPLTDQERQDDINSRAPGIESSPRRVKDQSLTAQAIRMEQRENGTEPQESAPVTPPPPVPNTGIEQGDGGPLVPITLEVRGASGSGIDKRKIVFQVADNKRVGMKGFMAEGSLVKEAIAFTDQHGRAVVKLQLEQSDTPLKIKRTIFQREDHTVCLLESVEPK